MVVTRTGGGTTVFISDDHRPEWIPERDELRPGELPPQNILQAIEAGLTYPVRALIWKERLRCEREGCDWGSVLFVATRDIYALDLDRGDSTMVYDLASVQQYIDDGSLKAGGS